MFEKISAAAQREKVGADWPNCSCHGEPMRWNAGAERAGGHYKCSVKQRAADRRWHDIRPDWQQDANSRRVRVGNLYVGYEHHFPGGRKAVAPLIEKLHRFKEKQTAERRSLTKEPAGESE